MNIALGTIFIVQWNLDITILDITMNIILCPGKSYSKMYGPEPRYNDTSI